MSCDVALPARIIQEASKVMSQARRGTEFAFRPGAERVELHNIITCLILPTHLPYVSGCDISEEDTAPHGWCL